MVQENLLDKLQTEQDCYSRQPKHLSQCHQPDYLTWRLACSVDPTMRLQSNIDREFNLNALLSLSMGTVVNRVGLLTLDYVCGQFCGAMRAVWAVEAKVVYYKGRRQADAHDN